MFRRKEEGLFDGSVDANQAEIDGGHEEQAVATAPQTAASFNVNNTATASGQTQTQVQPRQNSAPTANSFRPNNTATTATATPVKPAAMPASPAIAAIAASLDKTKTTKRVLTVGNDILLKGEIATCDRLVIDGAVDATLNDVHTVEISECGSFKGSAQIEDAEIRGLFEGDLTVRGRLVVYATGKVRGKISYGEIEIERGGELTGEIKLVGNAASVRPAVKPAIPAPKDDKVAA